MEVADFEFTKIKVDLDTYKGSIKEIISGDLSIIKIDVISLEEFLNTNQFVQTLSAQIALNMNVPYNPRFNNNIYALDLIEKAGLKTIKELLDLIIKHETFILHWSKNAPTKSGNTFLSEVSVGIAYIKH